MAGLEPAALSRHFGAGQTSQPRNASMTMTEENRPESRPFEADVARLLQLMVHSVYSEKSVFLRELIANAADACERLRYEAIAGPALLGDDPKPRITVGLDADANSSPSKTTASA